MDYRRFEVLVIGVTAAFVGASIALSWPADGAAPVEVAAQAGIVIVVAAAVHWGRKTGTLYALVASILYLWLRLPLIASGVSGPAILLVISRIAGYLLLGIVGGEVFGRIKYVFARSQDSDTIDDFSHVYSQRFVARAVRQALCRADRYSEPFAIVFVVLDAGFASSAKAENRRNVVRSVANIIRDDVRIVDDVAHLDDGRFAVLLPHSDTSAARVVAARLLAAIVAAHGVEPGHLNTELLSVSDDRLAVEAFCDSIEPKTPDSD